MTPKHVNMYRKDYIEKLEAEYKKIEYTAWINGQYIMCAIGASMDRKNKYPENPFLEEKTEEDISKVNAMKFEAYAIAFNQSRNGGDGSEQ